MTYSVHDNQGAILSEHDCILDACDALHASVRACEVRNGSVVLVYTKEGEDGGGVNETETIRASYFIPVQTVSEANRRDHWAVKAKRKKAQMEAAYLVTRGKFWVRAPVRLQIYLMRRGGRRLDADNLAGAFKGVIDGIAKALDIDDGDPRIEWKFGQTAKAPRGQAGVAVLIEAQIVGVR